MAAMVCSHCGKEHDERTKFCPLTGKAIAPAQDVDDAATTPDGVPVLPPRPAATPVLPADLNDAPGRATRLMFLPKGMKLPGQIDPASDAGAAAGGAGSAMKAPDLSAPASNKTMLAHVLPRMPVSTDMPPTPPLRPTALQSPPAPVAAPPLSSFGGPLPAAGAPALPTATLPTAVAPPLRPSAALPAQGPPPRISGTLPSAPVAVPGVPMPGVRNSAIVSTAPSTSANTIATARPSTTLPASGYGASPEAKPLPAPEALVQPSTTLPSAAAAPFLNTPVSFISGEPTGSRAPASDATLLDMRPPPSLDTRPPSSPDLPIRAASSGMARPAFPEAPRASTPMEVIPNPEATLRPSAIRSAPPDDTTTPRLGQPTDQPLAARNSATAETGESPVRKDSAPSWVASPEGSALFPEQSAVYAAANTGAGFARLLERTGKFYVANMGPVLLIALLVLLPVSLVTSSLVAGLGMHSAGAPSLVLGFLVSLLVMGTAWPLTTGTMTLAVLDRLHGGAMEPMRHWRFVFRRVSPLITALVPAAFITAIGYVLFVIPGLIASLLFAFVPTLVLLEGRQGTDALKRSALLMKEALGPAVGIQLIFLVLTLAVRKVVTTIVPGNGFLDLVASDLAFIAMSPLPMIALSIVYLDLRRSQEGVSPETLRHDIDALGL